MSSTNEARIEQIGDRIRALVAGRYGERICDAAVGIGIGEGELSALLQGRSFMPRTEVLVDALARVVRHFGVDPSWLVSGRYNVRSHVAAEEQRADMVGLRFLVHGLLSGPDRAVEMQPIERADMGPPRDGVKSPADWLDAPSAQSDRASEPKVRNGDEPER